MQVKITSCDLIANACKSEWGVTHYNLVEVKFKPYIIWALFKNIVPHVLKLIASFMVSIKK